MKGKHFMQNQNTIFTTILLWVACFALLPAAQAVVPAPDGGYPGGNTAEGQNALFSLTTGGYNTALGFFSLRSETVGGFNTAIGAGTLLANTAAENTATGAGALLSNTTGAGNTANGAFALFSNTTGFENTATGVFALLRNTASDNTATGFEALFENTTGIQNTASGARALFNNTTGGGNTATGYHALVGNTEGDSNTANGDQVLANNTTGAGNTAIGNQALYHNTSGSYNVALNGGFNLTTGNFNIHIANDGVADESNTMRIGILQNRCFISGIREVTTGVPDAINVVIDSAGQLGTVSSSRRFKDDIKAMDQASEALLCLRPLTFHYKSDHTARSQFGLIAEEVAEVNPDLVARDKNGEIYTVRYDQVNAMLLNEFLKEHKKVEAQRVRIAELNSRVAKEETIIAQQQKGMEILAAQVKEQAAQIQKVSAHLEMSKPATSVVLNNP
jgi:uncharacterized coiled-coil protein SlyX